VIPHRDLLLTLTRHQLAGRFRGSLLGWLWLLLNPLLTILLLSWVFGELLKIRWGTGGGAAYPIILFGGLIVHFFMAECLVRGPTLVSERPEYVHKIAFPLRLLGVVCVLESGIMFAAALVLFLGVCVAFGVAPRPGWLALPLVLAPLPLYGLALAWTLGALGPYAPDLKQLVGQLGNALLLLSPILYPIDSLPPGLRALYYLNPSTAIVENLRHVVFGADVPGAAALVLPILASAATAALSWLLFGKLKRGFADVL